MKILITGAKGFIGKNLVAELTNLHQGKAKHETLSPDLTLYEFDKDTDPALFDTYCKEAVFIKRRLRFRFKLDNIIRLIEKLFAKLY